MPSPLALALAFLVALLAVSPVHSIPAAAPRGPLPGLSQAAEPNPYLSIPLPGSRTDYAEWRAEAQAAMAARLSGRPEALAPAARLDFVEKELGIGANDEPARSEPLTGFKLRNGTPSVRVTGRLNAELPPPLVALPEDDGDIPHATDLGLQVGQRVRVAGVIGDGPHGSAGTGSGDYDFFAIRNVAQGQRISVIAGPGSALDPSIVLYDAAGMWVAADSVFIPNDDEIQFTVRRAGDYYLCISGFPNQELEDRFDSSSGFGAEREGSYLVTLSVDGSRDFDYYSFELEPGDILGARVLGPEGSALSLVLPNGQEAVTSPFDASFIYPNNSPLPLGGVANIAHVASVGGVYTVAVSQTLGSFGGPYTLEMQLFRPVLDGTRRSQKIFIDFDGATIDASTFSGGMGIRTLSPLAAFLPAFGLSPSDEDALIDRTLVLLRERLVEDFRNLGLSSSFALQIRNSRDDADTFGVELDVSRVIVGGSILESGIATIGISESIDVGNFADRESALVLLDFLADFSSSIPVAPGSTRLDLIATALANVSAHEIGHMLGNFHTSNASARTVLMDEGGVTEQFFQLGLDGVFGSADDVRMRFGADGFSFAEGMTGTEDTLNRIGFALETRRSAAPPRTRIDALAPASVLAGVRAAEILVTGDGFTPLSSGMAGGSAVLPRFEHRRLVGVAIDPLRLRLPGTVPIRVVTPGGGASDVRELRVLPSVQVIGTTFEQNAAGYATLGLGTQTWTRTTNRGDLGGHSARTSFYFGDPAIASYGTDLREAGVLTSPPLTLPKNAVLSFAYLLQSERLAPFDGAQVQLSTDGFATVQRLLSNFGEGLRDGTGRFEQANVDLSAFAGQSVQLRFVFDTLDQFNNDFEGWYVDDVTILAPAAGDKKKR